MRIREIAEVGIQYWYRRIHVSLFREEGLKLQRKTKKRLKSVSRIPSTEPANTLTMVFVSDPFMPY